MVIKRITLASPGRQSETLEPMPTDAYLAKVVPVQSLNEVEHSRWHAYPL